MGIMFMCRTVQLCDELGSSLSVYGFASVVAYTLMKDAAGSLTAASLENPVVIVILSMIVGAVFGYVSEKVAGMLAGMGSHPHHAKA